MTLTTDVRCRRLRGHKAVLGQRCFSGIVPHMAKGIRRLISLLLIAIVLAPMQNAQSLQDILDLVENDNRSLGEATPILQSFPIQQERSQDTYFPDTALDGSRMDWYLQHFRALGEKSLYSEGCEFDWCIRFTWLRTFHAPISIRVEFRPNSEPYLFFRQTDGLGGYEPGDISVSAAMQLNTGSEQILAALIQNALENEDYSRGEIQGFDGARWIIEYRDIDKYVLADQWSPGRGDIFALGTQLLEWVELDGAKRSPVY